MLETMVDTLRLVQDAQAAGGANEKQLARDTQWVVFRKGMEGGEFA